MQRIVEPRIPAAEDIQPVVVQLPVDTVELPKMDMVLGLYPDTELMLEEGSIVHCSPCFFIALKL